MRKLFFLFSILIRITACEESDNPTEIKTGFNKKILDDYFITSIAFEKSGSSWIGTFKKGLIKYNSEKTIVYNSRNSVIPESSVIYDIKIDSKRNVWIGCAGLIKFDGDSFTHFNSKNSAIPEDFVKSIAVDKNDNVWFASSRSRQGGIVKYDGVNWTVFTPDNSDLPVNSVKSIAVDNDNNIWIALSESVNDSYLVRISGSEWKVFTSKDLGFSPYYFGNIQINSKNELYGTIDYMLSSTITSNRPQVFKFNGSSCKILNMDSTSLVKFISIDNRDNIWCADSHGKYGVYDGKVWRINDTTFKSEGIFAIEQAVDGKIWVGTGQGIYIGD